ncbi:MAG: hypothetical protein ACRD2A_06735, partial [Vicinamibacterales bacterium]
AGSAFALAMTTSAWAQTPPAVQAPAPKAPPAEQQKAQPTTLQGDLLRVDTEAKTIAIQPAQGTDQVFKYTDDTKVVGGDKGVAGLATMKGSRVTVTFKTEGKDRVATQIEIHPRAGN